MASAKREFLRVKDLSQYFGTVPALVNINFTLESGEVLGVVGQRGAGKSTLFKILGGVYTPFDGQISINGSEVILRSASHARQLGIRAVHQYPELVDELDVLHNVFLGQEICGPRWLRVLPKEGEMVKATRELLRAFDMPLELVDKPVANLSDEQRQVVALGHALCGREYAGRGYVAPGHLLLLDDALEALSFARQQILLERIRELASEGMSVIMSSDDLRQIFDVTDAILVLYGGHQVAFRRTSETTAREIVELTVGSSRQERVTPMIWAFENYYAAQQQVEELRQAEWDLRQSLEKQDSLNRQLIDRLGNQVEALDRLNIALQEASRRLITEREAERKALARELHDRIIQDLLGYNYQLEEAENEVNEESQRQKLASIRNGIREVVGNLRHVCSDLRPPTIDNHGLSAAIRSLASQWSKQSGIKVSLDIDPQLGRLPEPIELSVFRIVQEGLSNVRKHAVATHVTLTLQRTPTASLLVRLVDNGHGMEAPVDLASLAEQKHYGLVGISERVSLLNGTLEVSSPPAGGLELMIEVPSPYPSIYN